MVASLKRSDEIQDVLALACSRHELLILVTPFLRFNSNFVALDQGELHVAATMTWEDASFSLRSSDLRIRFPMGLGFMEAPVKLLGFGLHQGRRTLRLSAPRQILEKDDRAFYRVERVGRVVVTYGTVRGDLLQGSLVDLSVNGAQIHAQRDLAHLDLEPGSVLVLTIPLAEEIRIEARGEVRHLGARSIGLEFVPKLADPVQATLNRWVFQHREGDQERLALRRERNLLEIPQPGTGQARGGILLVSADAGLEEALQAVFQPIRPLYRAAVSIQPLKDALAANPALVVFQVAGLGLDQRRRLRALAEMAASKAPVLLLGTDVDSAALFKLASEWKAASAMVWNPARAIFLQRLAQGIIRRSNHGGEPPMAPPEP